MKEGLNLLPSVAKFQAAKIKLKKKINLGMGFFCGFWLLLIMVIFGWLWTNDLFLKKAERENSAALNQYKSLVTSVVLSKRNKYQAKLVGKVLGERFEYGLSISRVSKLFSENITLENFEIESRKRFVLNGFLSNGSGLIEVEEKVRDINRGLVSGFKNAKLKSISVSGDGWNFEMEVDLT